MDATEELPTRRPTAALVLGRYRLGAAARRGRLRHGLAARDERLERRVAVKVHPGATAGAASARSARRWPPRGSTTRASSRSTRPARTDDARYLVSELVAGRDARAARGAPARCRTATSLRIGPALADALAHAHERGVIHRDVKPQNVIVPDAPAHGARRRPSSPTSASPTWPATSRSRARATSSARSPTWRPSRPRASAVDERADLYALALVLYEALAGRQPGARRRARPRPRAASARVLPPLRAQPRATCPRS